MNLRSPHRKSLGPAETPVPAHLTSRTFHAGERARGEGLIAKEHASRAGAVFLQAQLSMTVAGERVSTFMVLEHILSSLLPVEFGSRSCVETVDTWRLAI